MSFIVDVLTPSKALGTGIEAKSILVPTVQGQINVLQGHVPLMSKLDTGILTIEKPGGSKSYFVVTTGLCKVTKDRVTILANVAESEEMIDVERARRALKLAEEKLAASKEQLSPELIKKYLLKKDRAHIRLMLSVSKK